MANLAGKLKDRVSTDDINRILSSYCDNAPAARNSRDPSQVHLQPDPSRPPLWDRLPADYKALACETSLYSLESGLIVREAACRASRRQIIAAFSRSARFPKATLRQVCCVDSMTGSLPALWASQDVVASLDRPRPVHFHLFEKANHFAHYDRPVECLYAWIGVNDALDLKCKAFASSLGVKMRATRPWTTITYAQSLDGRIAANEGQPRLLLSGQESMQMTSRLRQQHDAILVTAATLNADDAQLTGMFVPSMPSELMVDASPRHSGE
jgi:hypothetical protein